jgi:hypothetical protein
MTPTLSQQDIDAIARRIADLADGSGTQRCVSLAEGALSADLRVNYELGMVLGVDEFRQEQHYFLQKEYLHNRALHGYGTVYGLRVTLARPSGDPNDVQVSVEPGMAIDQWGRVVMIRETQCARLGAWLAKNPAPDVGPSGEQRVYVALRYDECPDVLQPIAGQPCSGSDAQMAPARIRDGFHLELRWDEPRMPAYMAVQRFARLLAAVQVEPGLPASSSDEATILAVLRGLNGEGESVFDQGGPGVGGLPLDPPRDTLLLPAEGLRDALDRIFAVWATEVRPKLPPDLTDPAAASGGDPAGAGILLAAVDFLAEPPYIAEELLDDSADNGLRPVLLHTQLIQQLLLLGGRAAPPAPFAALRAYGTRVIHAWIHYPAPLELPPNALQVLRDGREVTVGGVRRLDAALNLFEIVLDPAARGTLPAPGPFRPFPFPILPPGFRPGAVIGDLDLADRLVPANLLPAPGARLEVSFRLDRLELSERGAFAPAARLGAGYIGYDRRSDTILVRAIVEPSQEAFAELQARGGGSLHLWVNYPAELAVPPADAFALASEGQPLQVIEVRRLAGALNHLELTAGRGPEDLENPGGREGLIDPGAQVELRVDLRRLALANGEALLPALDQGGFAFLNRDGDSVTLRAIADRLPAVRELVTVRTVSPADGQTFLTLWFHPLTEGEVHLPTSQEEEPALRIYSVERGRELRFALRPVDPEQRDGRDFAELWQAELSDESDLEDGERLVLIFLTARVLTAPAGMSLAELIEQQGLAFVGFSGNDRVRVFHQVSRPPAAGGGEIDPELIRRIVREQLLRRPNLPFVTLTPQPIGAQATRLVELWFHLSLDPFSRDALLGYSSQGQLFVAQLSVQVFAEVGAPALSNLPSPPVPDPNNLPQLVEVQQEGMLELLAYNRCNVLLNQAQLKELGNPPLRFIFPVDSFLLGRGQERFTLRRFLEESGEIPISFSGYDGEKTIVAFLRLPEEVG